MSTVTGNAPGAPQHTIDNRIAQQEATGYTKETHF